MAKKRVHRPEGSRPLAPHPARPARGPSADQTGRTARQRFEDASRPALSRMRLMPTYLVPSILAVALFLGLAVPAAWAGVFLVLIGLFLTWLTALSWPTLAAGSRVLRTLVDLGVLALGVLKLLGRI